MTTATAKPKSRIEQAKETAAAKVQAERELAKMYATMARDPAGGRVLADISGMLANPDFECEGLASRPDGFMARYRAAQRIDIMIRMGRGQ